MVILKSFNREQMNPFLDSWRRFTWLLKCFLNSNWLVGRFGLISCCWAILSCASFMSHVNRRTTLSVLWVTRDFCLFACRVCKFFWLHDSRCELLWKRRRIKVFCKCWIGETRGHLLYLISTSHLREIFTPLTKHPSTLSRIRTLFSSRVSLILETQVDCVANSFEKHKDVVFGQNPLISHIPAIYEMTRFLRPFFFSVWCCCIFFFPRFY